jgi:hypothetical protein
MRASTAACGWVVAASVLALSAVPVPQRPNSQRLSPHETATFQVGGCQIAIIYGRPSKRGRVIWGGLVRWDRWWMPGADEATIISTDHALVIAGLKMPAGQHTFYMWPAEQSSKLIISNETGQFHTVYHPDRDLGRVDLTLKTLATPVEQMTFTAEPRPGGGVLTLSWDDRAYWVAFEVLGTMY